MITPSSNLLILKGAPFSNDNKNFLTFANKEAQYNYFVRLAKFPVTSDFTYIRENGGAIRVEITASALHECNYIMFNNPAYENKWLYAFITNVEYKSDSTSWIYFTLDNFQTWQFDFIYKPCFVVREHVNDDTIGMNTVPEDVNTGIYKMYSSEASHALDNFYICLGVSDVPEGPYTGGKIYLGTYSGLMYYAFPHTEEANVNLLISAYAAAGKSESIKTMFTFPGGFISVDGTYKVDGSSITGIINDSIFGRPNTLDGYTPKNNKCLTYPYQFLKTSTKNAQTKELRYEFFENPAEIVYSLRTTFCPNPDVHMCFLNYAGFNDIPSSIDQSELTISGWPLLAWVYDAYQNYLARNSSVLALQTLTAALSMGVAAQAANIPATTSAASVLVGQAAELTRAQKMPNEMGGSFNGGNLQTAMATFSPIFYRMGIRAEYAKILDDYFTMFGYKINRIKTPNVFGRSRWNFLKTFSAIVRGECPAEAQKEMETALNNGCTFWHTTDVGNYTTSNNIV